MPAVNNNFNGGTRGADISRSNSGGTSGVAFDEVRKGRDAFCDFAGDPVYEGALCGRFHADKTEAAAYVGYTSSSMGQLTTVWGRTLLRIGETPRNPFNLVRIRDARSKALATIELGSGGRISNRQGEAGDYKVTATSDGALPVDKWVRLDFKFVVSTTHGHIHTKIYFDPESNGSPKYDLTDRRDLNTGSGPITQYHMGVTNEVKESGWFRLDAINWNTTDYPGPFRPGGSDG